MRQPAVDVRALRQMNGQAEFNEVFLTDARVPHGDVLVQQITLMGPGLSIAGGTDEVQRNILGERVLGLPPEPRVDKDVPFRQLRPSTVGG